MSEYENGEDGNIDGTYDIESNGIPQFVDTDYIESSHIREISKFRSGIGHDYSDDFESCRSMKHYFMPDSSIDWSTIRIYAPISGTVSEVQQEWAGTQIRIQSEEYPAFYFIIFHINLDRHLSVGETVAEGQKLGFHIGPQTMSDIAIGVQTKNGWKLVSYFSVITDQVYQSYFNRGINSREDLIITEEERDADPLSCNGDKFFDGGLIENMLEMNDALLTSLPCGPNDIEWIQPYGSVDHGGGNIFFHDGIDFGNPDGKFYSSANGIVTEVELNTGKGWPGTNYRIVIQISDKKKLDYHFEIGGEAPEDERRDNIYVSGGDWVRAGQHIGNLISINKDVAHVHWGIYETEPIEKCPLDYFAPSLAENFEALYDSGIEKRPNSRLDLCDSD